MNTKADLLSDAQRIMNEAEDFARKQTTHAGALWSEGVARWKNRYQDWLRSGDLRLVEDRPTGDQLRDVAWSLDALTKLASLLLEPIAAMDEINAAEMEVTVTLTIDDRPVTPEQARKLIDWAVGEEMQDDLRRWADAVDAATDAS